MEEQALQLLTISCIVAEDDYETRLYKNFQKHLHSQQKNLGNKGIELRLNHSSYITAGYTIEKEITRNIEQADIVLAFTSPDFSLTCLEYLKMATEKKKRS